jgi:16S rRNA (adenine1518-N6/adenine1519-N6)-dimethyltransferase
MGNKTLVVTMKDVIPKKSLGQHWLHDDECLEAMVFGADVQADDTVLEIGPGLGTLTKKLLETGAKVVAVEFDHDLAEQLPSRVQHENLTVIEHDILTFDVTQLPPGYKVAANIPYYLTSNLLRTLCESGNPFSKASLLMQQEVAERVVASPGQMSLLAVSVQLYCEATLGEHVPAELFTPPPKVDSQILLLEYRTQSLFPDLDTKLFFRTVKAGFSMKRKKMRSSLATGLHIGKSEAELLLKSAGISPDLRAQALSLEDWHRLYLVVKESHA